ncbi:MAG: hypothetical protein KUG77_18315 [Nannocystaceae bacterium]|nr:hypothetical protein [Nannocystaceae bacterium]
MSGFKPAVIGDSVTHDGVTPCGVIGPHPTVPPTVLVDNKPIALAGCIVMCSGATPGGLLHPPAPSSVVASNVGVQVGGMAVALRSPSPDLTACGALLESPTARKPSSVIIGVYVPLPPKP